jgi:class 3 adenylate cyclase
VGRELLRDLAALMMSLVRRLLSLGLRPDMSKRDARYVHVTNALILFAAVLQLALAVVWKAMHLPAWFPVLLVFLYSSVFILTWMGYFHAARVTIAILVTTAILCTNAFIGQSARSEVYFIVGAGVLRQAFPPEERRTAYACAALMSAEFVALLVFGPRLQLLGRDAGDATRWITEIAAFAFSAGTGYYGQQRAVAAEDALDEERRRADALLHNMLPPVIAERLKRDPSAIADGFEAVTVLFADIVGFTPLAEKLAPNELVRLLNEVFSAFDDLARNHGLEKIKTIGDAYMVVGGLPSPRRDHAVAVAAMALDMHAAVAQIGDGKLSLRIGMHTGPVVAGVIGTSKFSYDLWGDTVNTASRMESHGSAGEIHLTVACRAALGDDFAVRARGVVDIKGKGPMETFWLAGRV